MVPDESVDQCLKCRRKAEAALYGMMWYVGDDSCTRNPIDDPSILAIPGNACARTRQHAILHPNGTEIETDGNRIYPEQIQRKQRGYDLSPPQLHPSHTTSSSTTTRPNPRTTQTNTQKQILPPPRRRQFRLPKRTPQHNVPIGTQDLRPRTRHLRRSRERRFRLWIGPVACACVARLAQGNWKASAATSACSNAATRAAQAVAVGWAAVAF